MESQRRRLREHLQEFITALARRVPHPARHTEAAIAADAEALRRQAEAKLAALAVAERL